jgi:hypothetical protein
VTLSRSRILFVAILALTVVLGARGITDESAVMLSGDMARYVMNGVFLLDFIGQGGAWTVDDLIRFTELYYARYPALSVGHHPPLTYVMLVPFYAVFGITMFSARLVALGFFVGAVWALYAVVRRLYDERIAAWAALLFVTNLMVLRSGQYVLSEMPMMALTLLSTNLLLRYCESRKPADFRWFTLAVVASLYAKQLAVFVFPAYAAILVLRLGWREFFTKPVLRWTVVGAVLTAPLVAMTAMLSPTNVGVASYNVSALASGTRSLAFWPILNAIVTTHLSLPLIVLVVLGAIWLMWRRDPNVIPLYLWIATTYVGAVLLVGRIEAARYAQVAMPAYFILAAGLATVRTRRAATVATVALSLGLAWQAWQVRGVRPSGAGGYEAAARYVLQHSDAPVVLFDSSLDTGYFMFFVRKHDPRQRLVIARADKFFVPPVDPVSDATKIYAVIRRFGIRFVVVEEPRRSPPWLRQFRAELAGNAFVERARFPVLTRDRVAGDMSLVVYEYLDPQPPDLEAPLAMTPRLSGRQIRFRLGDLVEAK